MGTRGSFPQPKVARHEADHSPVSRAEVLTIHGAIPPLLHMPSWQST